MPRLGVIGTNAAILSGVGGLTPLQVHLNGVQLVKVSRTSPEKRLWSGYQRVREELLLLSVNRVRKPAKEERQPQSEHNSVLNLAPDTKSDVF